MKLSATQSEIVELISQGLNRSADRFMLGICGAPGAGKSTLAEWIVSYWNQLSPGEAVLLPMDGYHFSNAVLAKMGLLHLKGIPDTFDADSFIEKLAEIRRLPKENHLCPRFDRSIEASIPDAIEIAPTHKLVVVEGNYLLLDSPPWNKTKDVLDEIWLIDAPEDLIYPRLLARHVQGGKNDTAAAEKVNSTDMPNARLVAKCRERADRVFSAASLEF